MENDPIKQAFHNLLLTRHYDKDMWSNEIFFEKLEEIFTAGYRAALAEVLEPLKEQE